MLYVDARDDYLMVKAYKKLVRLPIATCETDEDFDELKYPTIFSNRIHFCLVSIRGTST